MPDTQADSGQAAQVAAKRPDELAEALTKRPKRVRCPFCVIQLPAWARRAQWEHVDIAHRDDGPADTPWIEVEHG